MYSTQDRKLFLEALKPPVGYQVDAVIGTTYSLDLVSLLTVPLTFTMLDAHDEEGNLQLDPLKLLEAVRRHAGKLAIFCQAGAIHIPRQHRSIYGYLEPRVVEVQPSDLDGVFHPKVWVCRYTAPEQPVKYRLMVQSRNLTFDRSWDVMLSLDGELQNRQNAFAANHPLGDFIEALPAMAVHAMDPSIREMVSRVQHEIRRVVFEIPEPFEEMTFWPLGIARHKQWPFDTRMDRTLVISPFVSGPLLERLGKKGNHHQLITRTESLDQLSEQSLTSFDTVYVLQDAGLPESVDQEEEEEFESESGEGLHAKVYVCDAGWNANVWIGSANATVHAFTKNIEFLVELRGKKAKCGIDATLGSPDQRHSLIRLLQECEKPQATPEEIDSEQKKLEKQLERIRKVISMADYQVMVKPGQEKGYYELGLKGPTSALDIPEEAEVRCWPISFKEAAASIDPITLHDAILSFGEVDINGITSFIAFEVKIKGEKRTEKVRFICNFSLVGAPEDREERILRAMLANRDDFNRYILLLLTGNEEAGTDALQLMLEKQKATGKNGSPDQLSIPLFEVLLRALHRHPEQLDAIASLIESLSKTEDGLSILPEGFLALWEPIWTIRKEGRA